MRLARLFFWLIYATRCKFLYLVCLTESCLNPPSLRASSSIQYKNRNDICGILNLASWPVATFTHSHTLTSIGHWTCAKFSTFFLFFLCLVLGIFIISHFKKLHTRKYVSSFVFVFVFLFFLATILNVLRYMYFLFFFAPQTFCGFYNSMQ